MNLSKKVHTLIRVGQQLGFIEVLFLIYKKIRSRNISPSEVLDFAKFEIIESIDIDVLSRILSFRISIEELTQFQADFYDYKKDFEVAQSRTRKSFYNQIYDIGDKLSLVIYVTLRATSPSSVLETGVAAGVSSNLILNCIDRNKKGKLISIDITDQVGELIDARFLNRWELKVLPKFNRAKALDHLLMEIGNTEVFLHDSNHELSWQELEWKLVSKRMNNLRIAFFDDVTPALLNSIQLNYPDFKIFILNENRKHSAVLVR